MKIKMQENLFIQTHLYSCVIGYMRIYFHLPYRQTKGIIKATGKNLPSHPKVMAIFVKG